MLLSDPIKPAIMATCNAGGPVATIHTGIVQEVASSATLYNRWKSGM
jgi:hypothetical protein